MKTETVDKEITTSQSTLGLASLALYNIAFTVSDLDKAIDWYRDTLAFKLLSRTTFQLPIGKANVALLQGAGIMLELLNVADGIRIEELFAPAPQHLLPVGNKSIVFQVEDLKTASDELEAKGVQFVWREQFLMEDKMLSSMIEDLDGNKINIFQRNTTL